MLNGTQRAFNIQHSPFNIRHQAVQIRAARAPHPPLRGTFSPQAGRRTLEVGMSRVPLAPRSGERVALTLSEAKGKGQVRGSCILLKSFAVIRGSNLDSSEWGMGNAEC